MMKKLLPITNHDVPDAIVANWQGREIRYAEFLAHVNKVAEELPGDSYAVNLCDDRYLFLVTFFAVLRRGQTNLLPASKLQSIVAETVSDYTGTYVIADKPSDQADYIIKADSLCSGNNRDSDDIILIDEEHIAAVVFTSGSTGKPKANNKTWGSLYTGAMLAIQRFGFDRHNIQAIVATVPPQHMYGLETSIIIPMLARMSTVCTATFYPADIEAAVKSISGKCVLVSTPIHLKACVKASLSWFNIEFTISATAQMPMELARQIEKKLNTRLYEIYGASEFGSIATRQTTRQTKWTLYDGMHLSMKGEDYFITGPQFKSQIPLQDIIDIIDAEHFILLGRHSDLIKIAGKRISLAELNQKLSSIDGVVDGVFFIPQESSTEPSSRLTAFVVAPGMDKQDILNELKKTVEAVFLPRPLLLVNEIPRNETGKVPQKEMNNLYKSMQVS